MTWSNKAKVSTEIERGRILTPDNNQILVGATQSEILVYQEQETTWVKKTKTPS